MAITTFKVIQGHRFGTNRKPICDLISISELYLLTSFFPIFLHIIGQIFIFSWAGYLSIGYLKHAVGSSADDWLKF